MSFSNLKRNTPNILRALYHFIIAAQFWFGINYIYAHYIQYLEHGFLATLFGNILSLLYTTESGINDIEVFLFYNGILQTIFFLLCFFNDLSGSNEVQPKTKTKIRVVKDYYRVIIAFPSAIFISFVIWFEYQTKIKTIDFGSLLSVPERLDYTLYEDPNLPLWLIVILHANVIIFSLLEFVICGIEYPRGEKIVYFITAFVWIHLFGALSFYITNIIYHFDGFGVFFVIMFAMIKWTMVVAAYIVLYATGYAINYILWRHKINPPEIQENNNNVETVQEEKEQLKMMQV